MIYVSRRDIAKKFGVGLRSVDGLIRDKRLETKKEGNRRLIALPDEQTTGIETNRFVNGFTVPDNFDLITNYEELTQYTKAFASRDINFLLLVGSPGSGKSRQMKADLEINPCTWIDNHATNLGLYISVYNAKNRPVVLDDVNHLLDNRLAKSLLKALTQTEVIRSVSWESTAKLLEEMEIPKQFKTSSPICFIANKWDGTDADMAAIQDRALPVAFFPSAETIHEQVLKLGWCEPDVCQFIGEHLSEIPQPSMREYFQAMAYRKAGMNWRQKLLKIWNQC